MSWQRRRLKDVTSLVNGFPFDAKSFSDSGFPLVRIRDLFADEFETFVPEADVPKDSIIKAGDLVIGMDGDFNSVLWNRGPAALNQRLCLLRGTPEVDIRFIAYAISEHLKVINDLTYATTVKHLSSKQVANIVLNIPPLSEQRATADYLDRETARIDELIERQIRLADGVRNRFTALVFESVTGGVGECTKRPSRSTWFQVLPAHWDELRLKTVLDSAVNGTWGSDPGSDDECIDVQCLRVADFDRVNFLALEAPTIRGVKPAELDAKALQENDILIESAGGTGLHPVGFPVRFLGSERPTVSSNFITRLRMRTGQSSRYWAYALMASYQTRLTAKFINQTTGIQNLDKTSFFDELFPVPPSSEQESIANLLDQYANLASQFADVSSRTIRCLAERRAALITAAVTGRIDVSQGRAA